MERLFGDKRPQAALDSTGVLDMVGDFNDFLRSPTVQSSLSMPRFQQRTSIATSSSTALPDATPRARALETPSIRDSTVLSSTRLQSRVRTDCLRSRTNPDDSLASIISATSSGLSPARKRRMEDADATASLKRKRRAEEIDAKANILVAGVQNSRLESKISELQALLERSKAEQEHADVKQSSEVSRLKKTMDGVQAERDLLRQQLETQRQTAEEQTERYEVLVAEARETAAAAREMCENRGTECTSLQDDLRALRQQQLQQSNLVSSEMDAVAEEVQLWKSRYQESNGRVQELLPLEGQVDMLQREVERLKNSGPSRSEQPAVGSSLRKQLERLDELERRLEIVQAENTRLKASQRSSLLLQEKAASLESKLSRAEARAGNYEKLQLQYQELLDQHQKWSTLSKAGRPMSPTSVTRQLAELQQTQVVNLDRCSTLDTRCKLQEEHLRDSGQKMENLEKELVREKAERSAAEELAVRKERLSLFLTQERDGLRNILSSYQSMENPAAQAVAEVQLQEAARNMERQRVLITELQSENEKLGSELSTERLVCQKALKSSELCEEKLRLHTPETRTSAAVDQAEIQSLKLAVQQYEERLAKAEGSSATAETGLSSDQKFAVLHFADNPLQRRRDKLQQSQALGGSSASDAEVKALQQALAEEQKLRQRLEEVGRRKISELRSAYKVILGWKLDALRHGHYELRSVYSKSSEDCLHILRNASGGLDLSPTPLAEDMRAYINKYLVTDGQWPCFLAAINLHLAKQA